MTRDAGAPGESQTAFDEAVARVAAGEDPAGVARDLVGEMTVAERLSCLDGGVPFWEGRFDMAGGG